MLKPLVGSRSIEQILLFILINEEGYAHQIQHAMQLGLTSVQKALVKLEKGKILTSEHKGKRKIYRFDTDFCLSNELEMLLKKAYQELPLEEKKSYDYLPFTSSLSGKETGKSLLEIWEHLQNVNQMNLFVHSKNSRKGKAKVEVEKIGNQLIFQEQGIWQGDQSRYTNHIRWTYHKLEKMLSLEHLRHGINSPVFLFNLVPSGFYNLKSAHSYLCGQDTYFGSAHFNQFLFHVKIRTIGPKKNETIEYVYS